MIDKKYILSDGIKECFITPDDYSHWFGYYNYSPIDYSGKRMLAHRVNFDGRAIEEDDKADIGWFNLVSGEWNNIATTKSFNWQQGSMLQWLENGKENQVIFNDAIDGKFVSRIIEIDSLAERRIPWAVYGIIKDARTSISLQFERSYWCRAYHYESIKNSKWDVRISEEDGIFSLDLKSGNVKRIVQINDVLNIDYDKSFETSKHWLEHIMLNPSGTRFAFYHRYSVGNEFRTRIFTSSLDGSDLYIIPGWKDNEWSHMAWIDDMSFVVFTNKKLSAGKAYINISKNTGSFGKLIRLIYKTTISKILPKRVIHSIAVNSYYQIYKDKHGLTGGFSKGMLINDGHPSFTPDGLFMLTDTYQDDNNYRHLLLYDIANNIVHRLGKFYSPFNNCGYRSDLHPRFSPDYSKIIIDSAHSGKHQILVLELDWSKFK